MKKIIVFILAVVYLCSSAGVAVHLHYCMGKLINWSLVNSDKDKCGICGMKKAGSKDGGCCKDEHRIVKNISDQKITESAVQVMRVLAVATPSAFLNTTGNYFSSVIEEDPISHAPPRNSGVEVYIFNCVFRI